MAIYNNI